VGTWQSILDLETEQGDFSGKINFYPLPIKILREWETVLRTLITANNGYLLDQPGIDEEINNPTAASDSSQNQWHMPTPINLDSSQLRCSSRTEVLGRHGLVYSNTTLMDQDESLTSPQTAHLRSASQQSFKSALVLFSTICSFGYGLACMAHSLQEKVTVTSTSTFSNAINSYHCLNTLYNGTINCFSTLAQSSIASNETFS
jgi:hypothetical protein